MNSAPDSSAPRRRRRQSRFAVAAPKAEENNPREQEGEEHGTVASPSTEIVAFSRKRAARSTNTPSATPSVFGTAFENSDSESDGHGDSRRRVKRRRPLSFRPGRTGDEEDAQGEQVRSTTDGGAEPHGEQTVDPLDVFMQGLAKEAEKAPTKGNTLADALADDEDGTADASLVDDDTSKAGSYLDRSKKKRLVYEKVDHSKINYPPFQKSLYIEVPEIARMTPDDTTSLRRDLGNIRIRGRNCPKPVRSWGQCGLSSAVLDLIRRSSFVSPTPIQAQAIPCIMNGRDVIGIARTGSGKTLAFLLPLVRHVGRQARAGAGDGPVGLIVAPTRELAMQIFADAKRFGGLAGLRCVCAYGGSGVKEQIAELKRGADVVVCTPGRMIDLLAMNSGRITNLRRVTLVVLDEADRMFDMGFEPQLTRIVENVRPDRQTVMFSATFPRQVENLARKILSRPVEITIGGNSVAASTIDQHVEVRTEDSKFFRLLELLGVWYERGSTLVFVDRQDAADRIFGDLSKAKYLCLPLHGGRDQADRDSAIADFKNGVVKILVATSVAARGLDVKNLALVVNYDVPNHYEDYVHRVGRTGRAGRAGTAYTFITREQESYAPDLVKALTLSARAAAAQASKDLGEAERKAAIEDAVAKAVPRELNQLADAFTRKRSAGLVVHGSNSGYGGKGFKFDDDSDYNAAQSALRKAQAKRFGVEDEAGGDNGGDGSDGDESDDDLVVREINPGTGSSTRANASASAANTPAVGAGPLSDADLERMKGDAVASAQARARRRGLSARETLAEIARAKAEALTLAAARRATAPAGASASEAAAAAAAAISRRIGLSSVDAPPSAVGAGAAVSGQRFAAEVEINDYPQHARWQVTRKDALRDVEEFTACVITTRGNYYPAGRNPPKGQRKLHFLVEGPDERSVRSAGKEIKRKLEEASEVTREADAQYSKYSVV